MSSVFGIPPQALFGQRPESCLFFPRGPLGAHEQVIGDFNRGLHDMATHICTDGRPYQGEDFGLSPPGSAGVQPSEDKGEGLRRRNQLTAQPSNETSETAAPQRNPRSS